MQSNALFINELSAGLPSARAAAARSVRILAFVAFTAAGAQLAVRVPFTPVPITLQTLFVALAGLTLGPRDGFFAMIAYLGAGLAGAPVFAGFSFGPWALLGPTGGYLFAFPAAALVSGALAERFGRSRPVLALSALAGSGLVLFAGAVYLALLSGISPGDAMLLGVAPFAAGELVKAAAAASIAAR